MHFTVGAVDYVAVTRAGFALFEARGIVGAELRAGVCVTELFAVDDASFVSLYISNFGVTYDPSMARQSSGRVPPSPFPQVNPCAFVGVTAPMAVFERRTSPLIGACMAPSPLSGRNPP